MEGKHMMQDLPQLRDLSPNLTKPFPPSVQNSNVSPTGRHIPIETGLSNPRDTSKPPKQIQKSIQGFEPIPKKSAIIKTDKPRPHVCTTCTRAFARFEHLKRHERSHTNEKPFQCAACGRCFARRDLVLRHQQKLHTSLSSNKDVLKKGDNSNIITNYGNKEVSLPTINSMSNHSPMLTNESSYMIKNNGNLGRRFSKSEHSPSINSSASPSNKTDTPISVLSPESISKKQHPSARSTIASFPNNQSASLFSNSSSFSASKQAATTPLSPYSSHQPPPQKRHRHNSFSASSALSYTKEGATHLPVAHELPDAPKQVGFATPQLSATELSNKAIQNGIDLSALGLQYEIEEFNLDSFNSHNNSQTGYEDQRQTFTEFEDHENANNNNLQERSDRDTGSFTSRLKTSELTPGRFEGSLMSDYFTLANVGGGGAGFSSKNDTNFEFFNHDNKKKKRKIEPSSNQPSSSESFADLNPQNLSLQNQSNAASNDSAFAVNVETASTSIQNDTSSPEDWLDEFINTPFEANFISGKNLNSIGFNSSKTPPNQQTSNVQLRKGGSFSSPDSSKNMTPQVNGINNSPPLTSSKVPSPYANSSHQQEHHNSPSNQSTSSSNGIPSLFRTRQIDLFHKEVEKDENDLKLFTYELRSEILRINNLNDSQLPSLEELNKYVYLFKSEFDKYFPFIHLATLAPSIENYPFLLSIASVGALYRFHSTHAMLLFNISRFRIHEFLEKKKKSFKTPDVKGGVDSSKESYHSRANSVPIWVYQSMVLLIFIGIFNNDLAITKTMAMFLNSLIELVKITALNHPLENFLTPPPIINSTPDEIDELTQQQNFNYFILAQTRIRTCHTILLVSNLFTSLIGLDCSLHSIDLKCGIHCQWEELWQASHHTEWYDVLNQHNYHIDCKFSLVELSNGNVSYNNCLSYLTMNNYALNDDDQLNKKFQMKTLLSLLLSIHEKIYLERYRMKNETNGVIAATKWRMTSRPVIESLIKSWESLYIKNGGVFYLNEQSLNEIYNKSPVLRLILPLLSFAKIRKCINLTSIIEKIWQKDWNGMNQNLSNLRDDPEALKDATNYALDIVKLWIDYVSIHQDAEKTSMRTPVFFITCIFTSLLVIAEFLLSIEKNASNVKQLGYRFLNANERTLWLRSEIVFKKIENCLILNDNNKTYAEFLRMEAKGALDVHSIDDEVAKRAVNPNTDIFETAQVIQSSRLSSRGLYLGVRILADAPIWPIALLFAQALKARAIHISKSQPGTPLSP